MKPDSLIIHFSFVRTFILCVSIRKVPSFTLQDNIFKITILWTKTVFSRYINEIEFIFAVFNGCHLTLRKERLWKSLKI